MKVTLNPKDTYLIFQYITQGKASMKWIHLMLDLQEINGHIEMKNARRYFPSPFGRKDALGLFIVDLPVRFTPKIWDWMLTDRAYSGLGSTIELEINEENGQVIRMTDKTKYPDIEGDFEEGVYIHLSSPTSTKETT